MPVFWFYFPAEPADQHIDAPVEDLARAIAGEFQNLIPRQNPLRMLQKRQQQIELRSGKIDGGASRRGQISPRGIQPPAIECENPVTGRTEAPRRNGRSA